MKRKQCNTSVINIWIAGDTAVIERALREYCFDVGFCVTVTPTKYIYSGGQEDGVVVGIRNYPRFPKEQQVLMNQAVSIAEELIKFASQWSCMIEGPEVTVWLSRRPDDKGENG